MIAILSDIHGNLHALEAVLADMPAVSQIWSPGDMCTGPPFPCEVLDRLLNLGIPVQTVRGNHEDYLLDIRQTRNDSKWNSTRHGMFPWAADQLKPHHWAFIEQLPLTLHVDTVPGGAFIYHGTPDSTMGKIQTAQDAQQATSADSARWLVSGHTHKARLFPLQNGARNVIVAGSVGMTLDGIGGTASYVLLDENNGTVAFRSVTYDVEAAVQAMHKAGYFEIAPVIARAVIAQMRTGRHYADGLVAYVAQYAEKILGYKPDEITGEMWEEAEKCWDGEEYTPARMW